MPIEVMTVLIVFFHKVYIKFEKFYDKTRFYWILWDFIEFLDFIGTLLILSNFSPKIKPLFARYLPATCLLLT
jgi:hypothetical protein